MIRHGYVIACVNVRGGGASFGRYEGLFSTVETRNACDVIDWLAKQEFSNGNGDMYCFSYMGIIQYMAASTGHPALKAIASDVAIYHFGAWQDPYALDTLLHDANFRGTDKLAMGPWAQEPNTDAFQQAWIWRAVAAPTIKVAGPGRYAGRKP